jgi:hypothetical protein
VTNGTALSRGDRNRNDRLARLRALLPAENASARYSPRWLTHTVSPRIASVR